MSPTLGLVGDLCVEAEWIWRRVCSLRRSMQRCQDLELLGRLRAEVAHYVRRCNQIQEIQRILLPSKGRDSFHLFLLIELINRTLLEVAAIQVKH